jgi:hypothetical protein
METARLSNTSLIAYQITRRHIQEDSLLYLHQRENMKSNRMSTFQQISMYFPQRISSNLVPSVSLQTDRQTDIYGTDGTGDLRTKASDKQEMNSARWAKYFL